MQKIESFSETLTLHGLSLKRTGLDIVQINMGKLCNQACTHCHVEAGPNRTEMMSRETVNRLLELLAMEPCVHTVDITGGAPELNPHFRYFVEKVREMGKEVIDRCNLTILFESGQENLAEFLSAQNVQIVASLPCYSKDNVDQQRGKGVFLKSVRALHILNKLGYGQEGSGLILNLVYNPGGAFLPPDQQELEKNYKARLEEDLSVKFNQLFTITNMPIKRFAEFLEREGSYDQYMQLLMDSFNPRSVSDVMCTGLVSIGWDGQIYDCDFNQMLEIPIHWNPKTLWDIQSFKDMDTDIALENHCYGCTAGAGSSCGGSLIDGTNY